jgi:2-polyprenyl-3-methyl-5-hydroxy-6-metoxy-1,4-benzoquinol methylase
MDDNSERARREIVHGEFLAKGNTEWKWGWGTPAGRQRALRRANLIQSSAKLSPATQVLEIGCGTGNFTNLFARSNANIVAVDISPDLLEKARKRGLPANRVQFICCRFEEMMQTEAYDAVIGSSVLHHLELKDALAIIFSLLKPGGFMVFAEPNMLNPQVFAERTFLRQWLKHVSPDETAFVRWMFQKQLRHAGFDEIEIRPFDWLHPSVPRALINVVNFSGALLERTPIIKEFAGSLLICCRRPESK